MTDFEKEWENVIAPTLINSVGQAVEKLRETRNERFSLRKIFYPQTEFDNQHGVVLLTTQEDIVTPRMVSFSVYHSMNGSNHFYKLYIEAYTSFEQETPAEIDFEDDIGRSFECKFYRNAEIFKLRVEEAYLDSVFHCAEDLAAIVDTYPTSVLHDILNAALNTLIEEAKGITSVFAQNDSGQFNVTLTGPNFEWSQSH
ncbi:MAG: hypothetical protein K0R55_2049 [Sporomusa sp.]|nr:hypothetical protein [Sporomusa sp.]